MPAPMTATSPMAGVLPGEFNIGSGIMEDVMQLGLIRLLDDFSWYTDNHRVRRYILTLCYYSTCSDDRSVTYFRTIDNDCPHTDQHLVANCTSMEDRPMPDRDFI